jgi:hypothetical protein
VSTISAMARRKVSRSGTCEESKVFATWLNISRNGVRRSCASGSTTQAGAIPSEACCPLLRLMYLTLLRPCVATRHSCRLALGRTGQGFHRVFQGVVYRCPSGAAGYPVIRGLGSGPSRLPRYLSLGKDHLHCAGGAQPEG